MRFWSVGFQIGSRDEEAIKPKWEKFDWKI